MKKFVLFLALAIVVSLTTSAQTAKQILDKTAAAMSSKGGARANFSMSGKYGNVSGSIAVKGNKWTYMKKTQEVNVSTPTEAQQQSINPYKFIYIYKSGYTLSSKAVAGGWQVHLVAQNKSRSIKEMYITVSKGYKLKQVKMRQSSGWTTINVINFRKANLSDSHFRFNSREYPNAEVIDLR